MRQHRGGGGIQPLVTAWAQILNGCRTTAKPATDSMPAHISAGNMNERGREVGRGGGLGGGLSPFFSSSLKRVLAAKHLPCRTFTHYFYSFTREANICTCNSWHSLVDINVNSKKISMHSEKHAVF